MGAAWRRHGTSRGSVAARLSAVASVVITGLVVGVSVVAGPGSPGRPEKPLGVPSAPTPSAATSEVGQTRSGPNTNMTLLQVRKVLAPPGRTAPAGREWFGIRARTCLRAGARRSGGVPWSAWVVTTRSGATYAGRRVPWDDFPPQQYSIDGIEPGACNVGWVLVDVPQGTFRRVVSVGFRASGPDGVEWVV